MVLAGDFNTYIGNKRMLQTNLRFILIQKEKSNLQNLLYAAHLLIIDWRQVIALREQ
jgi:hypothetical protein